MTRISYLLSSLVFEPGCRSGSTGCKPSLYYHVERGEVRSTRTDKDGRDSRDTKDGSLSFGIVAVP
jgi:hypothetical protein